MWSPGLTSGVAPGGPNSLSMTRPSDFRPTSTMAYSSVRRRTRPVTTEPSKLESRPRVSSSRAEKFSPRKWSWVGAGAMARAVADAAIWSVCSVTDVREGLPGVAVVCALPAETRLARGEATAGRVAGIGGDARWASDGCTDTRHLPGVKRRNRDDRGAWGPSEEIVKGGSGKSLRLDRRIVEGASGNRRGFRPDNPPLSITASAFFHGL